MAPALWADPLILVNEGDGLRPVALWVNDEFMAPPRTLAEQEKLSAELLSTQREFPLYLNGEIQNYFYQKSFEKVELQEHSEPETKNN